MWTEDGVVWSITSLAKQPTERSNEINESRNRVDLRLDLTVTTLPTPTLALLPHAHPAGFRRHFPSAPVACRTGPSDTDTSPQLLRAGQIFAKPSSADFVLHQMLHLFLICLVEKWNALFYCLKVQFDRHTSCSRQASTVRITIGILKSANIDNLKGCLSTGIVFKQIHLVAKLLNPLFVWFLTGTCI